MYCAEFMHTTMNINTLLSTLCMYHTIIQPLNNIDSTSSSTSTVISRLPPVSFGNIGMTCVSGLCCRHKKRALLLHYLYTILHSHECSTVIHAYNRKYWYNTIPWITISRYYVLVRIESQFLHALIGGAPSLIHSLSLSLSLHISVVRVHPSIFTCTHAYYVWYTYRGRRERENRFKLFYKCTLTRCICARGTYIPMYNRNVCWMARGGRVIIDLVWNGMKGDYFERRPGFEEMEEHFMKTPLANTIALHSYRVYFDFNIL